jgi:predicted nucleic acid-binding protein
MTLVIDAGPLVAFADAADPAFAGVERLLRAAEGPLVVPAPVAAEADYLIGRRLGPRARRAFLADLAAGRFTVVCLERDDYATVVSVDARYADLDLGLADCALVVIADRYGTDELLTFDERHFRAVRPLGGGGGFRLLPADG